MPIVLFVRRIFSGLTMVFGGISVTLTSISMVFKKRLRPISDVKAEVRIKVTFQCVLNGRGFNSVVLEFACTRHGVSVEILKIRYIYQAQDTTTLLISEALL